MKTNLLTVLFILMLNCCLESELTFEQHSIDLDFVGISNVIVHDLDNDGDLDIIGGSEITPWTASMGLAFWRNDGGDPMTWTRITIDETFIHIMSLDLGDLDGDNNIDIIATSWQLDQIVWRQNSGNPEEGWTRYTIKSVLPDAHDARCADLDDDGDLDIVGVNSTPGGILTCRNDGALYYWDYTFITNEFANAKMVEVIDLDFDNDLDLVVTASDAGEIAWWENQGGNPVIWNKRNIASGYDGCAGLHVTDLNFDGKYDIVATAWRSNQLAYWICNDLHTDNWTKTTVSNNLTLAIRPRSADFDQDGDLDLVAVGKDPGQVDLFVNDDFTWTRTALLTDFTGGAALEAVDLDEDGDVDIIAGAGVLGDLVWLENKTIDLNIGDNSNQVSKIFHLAYNYPNPFNPETTIRITVPERSHVDIKIYNVEGHLVKTLLSGIVSPGNHTLIWNARDDFNCQVGAGLYICQVSSENWQESIKMLLVN